MSTYSDVSVVWLVGPWVVVGLLGALSFFFFRKWAKRDGLIRYWFSLYGESQSDLERAQAEAREASAGHQECARQLKVERGNVDRLAESVVSLKEQLHQLTPKPAKSTKKPQAKKKIEKVKKPRAKN